MIRKAFTMLELVFAIVVIGILTSLAMPSMDRDERQEAADNILSAIRYTQHMALMDNVILPTQPDWQRSFWSFGTQGCSDPGLFYYVGADKDRRGNIDANEAAFDPANGLMMNGLNGAPCQNSGQAGRSPNIYLSKLYSIWNIAYGGGCFAAVQHIAFDYLGRPHTGIRASNRPDFSTLINAPCTITFDFTDPVANPPLIITIAPETGYASVVGQPNL